jgi:hypothetical protein
LLRLPAHYNDVRTSSLRALDASAVAAATLEIASTLDQFSSTRSDTATYEED